MRSPTSTRCRGGRLCTKSAEAVHNPPRRPTAAREGRGQVHDSTRRLTRQGWGSLDHGQTTVKNGVSA
jgi:hypothetical protein